MKKNTLSILEAIKRKITKIDDSDKAASESDNEISQEFEYIDDSQPVVEAAAEQPAGEEGQVVDDPNQEEAVVDQVEIEEESKASDLELEAQIEDNISEAQTEDIPAEESVETPLQEDEADIAIEQEDSDEDDFDLTFNNDDEQEEDQGIDLSDLDSSIGGDVDFDEDSEDQQDVVSLDDDLDDEEELEEIGGTSAQKTVVDEAEEEDDFEDFAIDEDEEEEKNSEFLRGQDEDPLAQSIEEDDDLADVSLTEAAVEQAVSDEPNTDYQQSMSDIEKEFNPQIEELDDLAIDESFSDNSEQLPDVDPIDNHPTKDVDLHEQSAADDELFDEEFENDEDHEDEDLVDQQDYAPTPEFEDTQEVAEEDNEILEEPEFAPDPDHAQQDEVQNFEENRQGFSAKSLSDIMQEEAISNNDESGFDQIDDDNAVQNVELQNEGVIHEDFAQEEVLAATQSNQSAQYNPHFAASQHEPSVTQDHAEYEEHTSDEEMNEFLDSAPDDYATSPAQLMPESTNAAIQNEELQQHHAQKDIGHQVVNHSDHGHQVVNHSDHGQQDIAVTAEQHQDFATNQIHEDVSSQIDNDIVIDSDIAGKVSKSISDLSNAKDMVTKVDNYVKGDMLSQVAFELMKPKLQNWFNENLPQLVEKIVREEIKKIISDNKE